MNGCRYLISFSAQFAGKEPAERESQDADHQLNDRKRRPVRIEQDRDRTSQQKTDDRPVRLGLKPLEQPFDELRDRKNPDHDPKTERNKHADTVQQGIQIKMNKRIHSQIDGRKDWFVIT